MSQLTHFPTTIHLHRPVSWKEPLPAISSELYPGPPNPALMSPMHEKMFDPIHQHFAKLATRPLNRLSFVHGGQIRRNEGLTWDPKNVLQGDAIYVKWSYNQGGMLIGRAIYGDNAQGPPGSTHGGSLLALLDDSIGCCGMMYAIQTTLDGSIKPEELTWRPNEETAFAVGKARKYLDVALDAYERDPTAINEAGIAPSPEALEGFKKNRDKLAPYTPEETAFIMLTIAPTIREMQGVPSNLVASVSAKLRRRTPLLTPLIVISKIVERKGRRMKIRAQILSRGGRTSAWEPEDPEGGVYGTIQAEAEGEAVMLWARDQGPKL